ncbi:hypothetical protein JCM10207_004674 [Rhodosporidiobolus poonsookiae]
MTPPSPRTVRSPSPTAPPLRAPSPLGGKSIVARPDGRIEISSPPRSTSAPPVPPAGPRPPSPGTASLPLNAPVQQALRTSKLELQKIDCASLQRQLDAALLAFLDLARALTAVQNRISHHWTVPQRAVRVGMKELLAGLTNTAAELVLALVGVSHAARTILNFVATCIKDTHGLRDFVASQPLTPVLDELRRVQQQWAALERGESRYGDALGGATLKMEQAMDPDGWTPTTPLTPPILHLASTHTTLLRSLTSLSALFLTLSPSPSQWHPPNLSPSDVKAAAHAWKAVERQGRDAAGRVKDEIRKMWEGAVRMQFVGKGEGEEAMKVFAGRTAGAAASPARTMPLPMAGAQAGARPASTTGVRGR